MKRILHYVRAGHSGLHLVTPEEQQDQRELKEITWNQGAASKRPFRGQSGLSGAAGQSVAQPVAICGGLNGAQVVVNGDVCQSPMGVVKKKMERAKGFEPTRTMPTVVL